MKIKTLFFGITRDVIEKGSVEFELDEGITIKNFQNFLQEKYSGLTDIENFAFAANEEYVTKDYIIKEGDVVAIIPPVSGG